MSELSIELQVTAEFCQEHHLNAFAKHIPLEWVEEAVKQTGQASVRKRRFSAEQAVWLVLGIGLLRDRSIQMVCDRLELAFPDAKGELPPLATSSISKGKEKLRYEPMRYLFKLTAAQWEKQSDFQQYCGLKTPYNIVRLEIAEMAKQHKAEPLCISFVNALYMIQEPLGAFLTISQF